MDNTLDRETAELVRNEKNIEDLCKHEAWPQVKQKFIDKVLDLQSTQNIPLGDPVAMAIEVQSRNMSVDVLMEWMRDIEGSAQKSKDTSFLIKKESYIIREFSKE